MLNINPKHPTPSAPPPLPSEIGEEPRRIYKLRSEDKILGLLNLRILKLGMMMMMICIHIQEGTQSQRRHVTPDDGGGIHKLYGN
jgi:hypothetical protein